MYHFHFHFRRGDCPRNDRLILKLAVSTSRFLTDVSRTQVFLAPSTRRNHYSRSNPPFVVVASLLMDPWLLYHDTSHWCRGNEAVPHQIRLAACPVRTLNDETSMSSLSCSGLKAKASSMRRMVIHRDAKPLAPDTGLETMTESNLGCGKKSGSGSYGVY
jgi:hypothetical protein